MPKGVGYGGKDQKSPVRKIKAQSTRENYPQDNQSPTKKVAARKTTDRVV